MRVADYFAGRSEAVGERWFSWFVGCGLCDFGVRGMQMLLLGDCVRLDMVVYQRLCRMSTAEGG